MPSKRLISPATKGVNQSRNPLFLGSEYVHHAANMSFEEGSVRTRSGFRYHDMGIGGQFQGSTQFNPSRGLSFTPFGPSISSVAIAADDAIFIFEVGKCATKVCDPVRRAGVVNLFQAENYLIAQSVNGDTSWYEGGGCMVRSPGMAATPDQVRECGCEVEVTEETLVGAKQYCCYDRIKYDKFTPVEKEEEGFHSHDSFIWSNHRNFLINGAGLGIYAHGRIHQEGPHSIYVSDIIHARGNKATDDILLMEEQSLASMGPPLSTNSSKGNLVAIAIMPKKGSASGEGDLIAYYEKGVVSFDTFKFPRETRHDAEGAVTQKGWDTQRMVSDLLGSISAVGRYAVTVLPNDHFFRSVHGLHFLKTILGEGVFNDEATNIISAPVAGVLDSDPVCALSGAATGHWISGSRMLATTGMVENDAYSATSFGRGFVSWNQAGTYTDDRTPIPSWEGVSIPDYDVGAIHSFVELGGLFGFVCSMSDSRLHFAEMTRGFDMDIRGSEAIPIEWEVITGKEVLSGLTSVATVSNGFIEAEVAKGTRIKVEVRSDANPEWANWFEMDPVAEDSLITRSFGMPPKAHRDSTWVQLRVTGVGRTEILLLDVSFSEGRSKGGGRDSTAASGGWSDTDFFRIKQHQSKRWS